MGNDKISRIIDGSGRSLIRFEGRSFPCITAFEKEKVVRAREDNGTKPSEIKEFSYNIEGVDKAAKYVGISISPYDALWILNKKSF